MITILLSDILMISLGTISLLNALSDVKVISIPVVIITIIANYISMITSSKGNLIYNGLICGHYIGVLCLLQRSSLMVNKDNTEDEEIVNDHEIMQKMKILKRSKHHAQWSSEHKISSLSSYHIERTMRATKSTSRSPLFKKNIPVQ